MQITIPSGYNLTSVMSDSHADHEDDEDGIRVLQGSATLGSDTETDDRDEEKNNVDNEDDEEDEITAPPQRRPRHPVNRLHAFRLSCR